MKKKKINYLSGVGEAATVGFTTGALSIGAAKMGMSASYLSSATPFLKPMVTLGQTGVTLNLLGKVKKASKKVVI